MSAYCKLRLIVAICFYMNKENIIKILKQSRIDKGWSQYRLATEIKTTAAAISANENMNRFPHIKSFIRILRVLNITIDNDAFRNSLVAYQKKHGFTCEQLARLTEVTSPQLYKVLNGKTNYRAATITKICNEIGLPLEDFLIC